MDEPNRIQDEVIARLMTRHGMSFDEARVLLQLLARCSRLHEDEGSERISLN
jgi:hypothetical protein